MNKTEIGVITDVRLENCISDNGIWKVRVTGICPYAKPKKIWFSALYSLMEINKGGLELPVSELHTLMKSLSTNIPENIVGAIVQITIDKTCLNSYKPYPSFEYEKQNMDFIHTTNIVVLKELMYKKNN